MTKDRLKVAEDIGQMTEDIAQSAGHRGQCTEQRRQKTEDEKTRQIAEDRRQRADCRGQSIVDTRQGRENKKQTTENVSVSQFLNFSFNFIGYWEAYDISAFHSSSILLTYYLAFSIAFPFRKPQLSRSWYVSCLLFCGVFDIHIDYFQLGYASISLPLY